MKKPCLLLLFELVELYFDEGMMFQHPVKSGEELRTEALIADLQRGLEPLGLGFEIPELRIGKRKHGARDWSWLSTPQSSGLIEGFLDHSGQAGK